MILVVVITAVLARLAALILGFLLGQKDMELKSKIKESLEQIDGLLNSDAYALEGGLGEYLKALADLAMAIAGLSPAIQAFLISTIFFLIAATWPAFPSLSIRLSVGLPRRLCTFVGVQIRVGAACAAGRQRWYRHDPA